MGRANNREAVKTNLVMEVIRNMGKIDHIEIYNIEKAPMQLQKEDISGYNQIEEGVYRIDCSYIPEGESQMKHTDLYYSDNLESLGRIKQSIIKSKVKELRQEIKKLEHLKLH